jgi:hypothetical protein
MRNPLIAGAIAGLVLVGIIKINIAAIDTAANREAANSIQNTTSSLVGVYTGSKVEAPWPRGPTQHYRM